MKKILFINPAAAKTANLKMWSSGVMNKLMDQYVSTMPKMTGMIFAAITPAHYEFVYLDEDIEDIDFDIDVDIVAITAMTEQANRAYQIADQFREKGVTVAMGGIHATILADEAGEHCDIVMTGEGENTWPAMLEDFENGTLKKVYAAKDYPPVEEFVIPKFNAVQADRYTIYPMQATRGCPYDCDFCSIKFSTGKVYRTKPVQQVITEIKEIEKYNKKTLGAFKKSYMFIDDNLYVNRDYVKELFTAMQELDISWIAQGGINTAFDDEILDLMSKSGCQMYSIGFESLSDEALKDINKPKINKTEDYISAINNLIRHGIVPGGYFIFGFDCDDSTVFKKTADFAINHHLMHPFLAILTPYPGTRLNERMESAGRIFDRNWKNYNSSECVFTPTKMDKKTLQAGTIWITKRLAGFDVIKSQLKHFWQNAPKSNLAHLRPLSLKDRMILLFVGIRLLAYRGGYTNFLFWVMRQKDACDLGSIFAALSLHDIAMNLGSPDPSLDFNRDIPSQLKNR